MRRVAVIGGKRLRESIGLDNKGSTDVFELKSFELCKMSKKWPISMLLLSL